MEDSKKRLIEAAVRPFSDNAEMRHAAADFLEQRGTTNDNAAAAMVTRWNEVDGRKHKSFWHIGLWVVVAVASMTTVYSDFDEISRLGTWGKWIAGGSIFTPLPDATQRVASKLSEADKLLLFGDLAKDSKSERKEALWRSEPENPAYFADYAGAFISDNDKLPPDFLETARRLDPTNAWFTYLAAAVEARDSVKSKSRKSKRVAGKIVFESPREWEILDQARLDRAMALLVEARNQPKCNSYRAEMLQRRLPLLPQATSIEQLDSASCLSAISVFSSIRLRVLGDSIAVRAWSAGESGDVRGFQEISSDGELFLRRICSAETGTLVDELVGKVIASTLADSFAIAAEKLRLEQDAARWKPIAKWMMETKERRDSREFIVDGKAVESGTRTGGFMTGSLEMVAKQAETQPPLTDADLKPMRLHDHELLSWIFGYGSWLVMALCVGLVASYRFRVAVLSRRLARRMEDLLRPSDWGWIIVAGVVLPFVFVMAVNRQTPLGGREFGALLMPAGHFLGLWALWLILPAQIVRWRLAKRAGGFGFPGPSWMGWLAVACAAAFVPMIGWAAISGSYEVFWLHWVHSTGIDSPINPGASWAFRLAAALLGTSVLWLAVSLSIALLSRAERQLYRATSSRVLVTVYLAALLVSALATIGFKASQQYWFTQDTLTKFDVSGPGWTRYESKVAARMRTELQEILGYDRAP